MKAARYIVGALFFFVLALKLFTFEYFLKDDPVSGLAFRARPSMSNRQLVQHTPSRRSILMEDDNDFLGAEFYYLITHWGLEALLLTWLLLSAAERRQARARLANSLGR